MLRIRAGWRKFKELSGRPTFCGKKMQIGPFKACVKSAMHLGAKFWIKDGRYQTDANDGNKDDFNDIQQDCSGQNCIQSVNPILTDFFI